MKIIRLIVSNLSLIGSVILLYTMASAALDIMVDDDTFRTFLAWNCFVTPILGIISSILILNKEE